jgi:hypothetical protein
MHLLKHALYQAAEFINTRFQKYERFSKTSLSKYDIKIATSSA